MVIDGERLKTLLKDATTNVVLCAPFIKSKVLRTVLGVVPSDVHVLIVTRWKPTEIAAGVSDIEVYDVANDRPNTELRLLQNLHAKIYTADDKCLIGSANLTASALGWGEVHNIELMIQTQIYDSEVELLLKQLKKAELVSLETKLAMESAVENVESVEFDEAADMTGNEHSRQVSWLPRCAAPEKLYEIYKDPGTKIVAESTKQDGKADLQDLFVAKDLKHDGFAVSVQDNLMLMPAFAHIINMVPTGITDELGRDLIANTRPDLDDTDAHQQWRIVRDWIRVFFSDRFEVAPESYVTRLKQRS